MKRITLLTIVLALCVFASCKKDFLGEATVNLKVEQFSLISEDMGSKASDPAKRLDVAVYNTATEQIDTVYSQVKSVAVSNFGNMSIKLHAGAYKLIAVGHQDSTGCTITGPTLVTFNNNAVQDVFAHVEDVTVSNSTTQNILVALDRPVSLFRVKTTDVTPEGTAAFQFVYSAGGTQLNPTTNLSANNSGRTHAVTIPSSKIGQTISVKSYIIPNSNPQNINITVSSLNASNEAVYSHTFNNVSLAPNKQVTATGNFFCADNSSSFTFNTTWADSTGFSF